MTKSDLIEYAIIAGLICLAYIIVGNEAWALEQIAMQPDPPWWDKYQFEIAVSFGASIVGYIGAQHYKTRSGHQKAVSIAAVNGLLSGVLAAWIFYNHYPLNQAAQWGVMVGGASPALVWILFQIVDRVFPGKGEVLKKGLFIPENDDEKEEKSAFEKVAELTAVAIVGKRKDQRKSRTGKEIWTPEQREKARNGQD